MKVLLNIKDDKAEFILEVLKNFKGVKVTCLTKARSDVFMGLKEALDEVELIKAGKLKGIPAHDLLNELE